MTAYDPESTESHRRLARALLDLLADLGFAHDISARAREQVYRKTIDDQLDVLVYTTIEGNACRGRGADAIRVCLMYTGEQPRSCGTEKRVNRVGTIDAICQRVRERVSTISDSIHRCPSCGAPTFRSRAKKDVCAALCWKRGRTHADQQPSRRPEPARDVERRLAVVPDLSSKELGTVEAVGNLGSATGQRSAGARRRFRTGHGEPW